MTSGGKPASLGDVVKKATRAERTATVCLAGDLNARYDELEVQLQRLTVDRDSLADGDGRVPIAEEMAQVREQMRASEHFFTFRALAPKEWSDLLAIHPPREDKQEAFNTDTFPQACVIASLVRVKNAQDDELEFTEADVEALWDGVLSQGQRNELFGAAWEANTGRVSVPFSALASVILGRTSEK
jgi:hypothetical protein